MTKLFTVMLMICSIYSSSPGTTDYTTLWENSGEIIQSIIYDQQLPAVEDKPADAPGPGAAKTEESYLEELKNLGYYKKDNEDEKLNNRNAVIRFQSDHNLMVDGIWGKESSSALEKRKSDESFRHPDEITEPPSEGMWITVNKTKRILTLYTGKNVTKKYPIAVGRPSDLTPTGKFKISTRVVNPSWGGGGYAKPVAGGTPENPLGYRWMGLSLKGGNRYGIHGNSSPYSIGKEVSHGCIRMINADVEELFEIVPVSSEVWIGTDSELAEWGVSQKKYIQTDS